MDDRDMMKPMLNDDYQPKTYGDERERKKESPNSISNSNSQSNFNLPHPSPPRSSSPSNSSFQEPEGEDEHNEPQSSLNVDQVPIDPSQLEDISLHRSTSNSSFSRTSNTNQPSENSNENNNDANNENSNEVENNNGTNGSSSNYVRPQAAPLANPEGNAQGEVFNIIQFQNMMKRWRIAIFFTTIYFIMILLSSVGVLATDWSRATCKKPLREWLTVLAIHHLVMIAINIATIVRMPRTTQSRSIQRNRVRKVIFLYAFARVLDFFWFIWFLLGASWTFTSGCQKTAPHLWGMGVALMVFHCIIFLSCCCCSTCGLLQIITNQGGQTMSAATKSQIKALKSQKFSAAKTDIPKDDAVCAVCLGDYEEGELLRYLPCMHHFHSDCVDKWLLRNKTCPLCKQLIDEERQEVSEG